MRVMAERVRDGSAVNPMERTNLERINSLHATRAHATDVLRDSILSGHTSNTLRDLAADRELLVVMSPTVERLYGGDIRRLFTTVGASRCTLMSVPTGEASKNRSTAEVVIESARGVQLPRDGLIIGIGGGILLDIAGFAAAEFRRGVAHMKVGTTLVAQVDAAIGAKCGVNVGSSKNLVGAFHPPIASIIDGSFLTTVSMTDVRCGLAEMLKMGIICDSALFDDLTCHGVHLINPATRDDETSRRLIDQSVRAMLSELQSDLFEQELRRRVDFGHTISPAIESRSNFDVRHGEAVAIDMAYFATVSHLLGALPESDHERILQALEAFGLPIWHEHLLDEDLVTTALDQATSHRGRRMNQPMPRGVGVCEFIDDRRDLDTAVLRASSRLLHERALDD